jgi:hypothetical protein
MTPRWSSCANAWSTSSWASAGITSPPTRAVSVATITWWCSIPHLQARYLPFDPDEYKFVVAETGIRKREAADEYAKRLALFQQLLLEIRKFVPKVVSLRDVTPEAYEPARKNLDILLRKRLDHVVYENLRVRRAKDLLTKGDVAGFGAVLSESHESLADRLKVTCQEVDLLYQVGRGLRASWGGRMAASGSGSCGVLGARSGDRDLHGPPQAGFQRPSPHLAQGVPLWRGGGGQGSGEPVGPGAMM